MTTTSLIRPSLLITFNSFDFSLNDEQFGEKRIEDKLNELRDTKASDILTQMNKSINSFCAGAQQSDDITMFMIEHKNS